MVLIKYHFSHKGSVLLIRHHQDFQDRNEPHKLLSFLSSHHFDRQSNFYLSNLRSIKRFKSTNISKLTDVKKSFLSQTAVELLMDLFPYWYFSDHYSTSKNQITIERLWKFLNWSLYVVLKIHHYKFPVCDPWKSGKKDSFNRSIYLLFKSILHLISPE